MINTKAVILNGKVIHIGDWDYQVSKDLEGNSIINNPLPLGAEEGYYDITTTANGSYVLVSDYKTLRKAEYPSIGDQLDALFKAGVFPEYMTKLISEVKTKYPKS